MFQLEMDVSPSLSTSLFPFVPAYLFTPPVCCFPFTLIFIVVCMRYSYGICMYDSILLCIWIFKMILFTGISTTLGIKYLQPRRKSEQNKYIHVYIYTWKWWKGILCANMSAFDFFLLHKYWSIRWMNTLVLLLQTINT